ncbi:MAG: hypothetical protein Q8N84_00220 [bacterium]|nr:hypothetical protein [bacterium]
MNWLKSTWIYYWWLKLVVSLGATRYKMGQRVSFEWSGNPHPGPVVDILIRHTNGPHETFYDVSYQMDKGSARHICAEKSLEPWYAGRK